MESQADKRGRFQKTCSKVVVGILKLEGIIQRKPISIVIWPTIEENHINVTLANQLFVPELSIIEKKDKWGEKQYAIRDLQLKIDEYKFTFQFNVTTIYLNEVDIILGLSSMETLETIILNMKKTFLTFSYNKKQVTLQDVRMKLDSKFVASKDFTEIAMVISQENQKMQSEFDKIVIDKEEEISRLRDHNQKLLLQIKKTKDKAQQNQKLEEENRDLQKKLLENIDENGHLKKHKQDLMDQIQKLKDDKKTQEEMTRNLKKEKDSLDNKLDQIQKRTSKPLDSKIYVEKKEANTNSVLVTVKNEDNLVKKKTTITPYQHPNHINQYPKKWELSKDNGTNVLKAPADRSIENPNSQQQINFGWIDPSTYRKLCFTLRSSYRHVLSATTSQGMMQQHYKALRTKPF